MVNYAYNNGKQNKQSQKQKIPLINYDDLPKLALQRKAILAIKKQKVYEIKLEYFYENKDRVDEILERNINGKYWRFI